MQTDARLPTDPASVSYEMKGQEEEKFMSCTVVFLLFPSFSKALLLQPSLDLTDKLGSKGT